MNAQQVAEQLADALRRTVREAGYADADVLLLTADQNERAGRGRHPGVAVEISGFSFTPFRESLEIEWDGFRLLNRTWRTPDGFRVENWSEWLALVYED